MVYSIGFWEFILRPVAYLIFIGLAGAITAAISSHSDAWFAYASLSGWWAGLLFAVRTRMSVKSAAGVFAAAALFGLVAITAEWHWYHKDAPTIADPQWVEIVFWKSLTVASPILLVCFVRALLKKFFPIAPRAKGRRTQLEGDETILSGKTATLSLLAIEEYLAILKAQVGGGFPDDQNGRREPFYDDIIRTYIEVQDLLRRGRSLPEEERNEILEDIRDYEALTAKLSNLLKSDGEWSLWSREDASSIPNSAADVTRNRFTANESRLMRYALDQYIVASDWWCSRADVSDDEASNIGNDVPLYQYGLDAADKAWRLKSEAECAGS